MESFSNRHGYNKSTEKEITVRQDAPLELRGALISIAYEAGFRPKPLRTLLCGALRKRPDLDNWSEYPNIDEENRTLIDECEWYKVYDIIEIIYKKIKRSHIHMMYKNLKKK